MNSAWYDEYGSNIFETLPSTLVAVRYHAVLKVCYERWRAAGQAAKVALTAGMRKLLTILNAMVKHHTPWQPKEVSIA
jgi:hypothetical protein